MKTTVTNRICFAVLCLVSAASAWAVNSGPVWESKGSRCVPNFNGPTTYVGYICIEVGSAYKKLELSSRPGKTPQARSASRC